MVMGAKTRNLLLDTNLLLLYLIGGKDPKLLESARRLNAYIEEDFYLLVDFIEVNGFSQLVSTPHILTEASNLIGLERDLLRTLGRDACMLVDEPEFTRLGLTDVAIRLASRLPAFVLTADLPLYLHLSNGGVEVENFNHIRQGSWS